MSERTEFYNPNVGFTPEMARFSDFGLEGKVAVVTGGSRGIGAAIATRLGFYGADIVINSRGSNEQQAFEVIEKIRSYGKRAEWFKGDISNSQICEELIEKAVAQMGRIDFLIHNAGITRDNLLIRMGAAEWEEVMGTNLDPMFYATKPAIARMIRQKPPGGVVVAISSINNRIGKGGQLNYVVSKAGLEAGTKVISSEYAKRGVRGVFVACGAVNTDILATLTEEQLAQAKSEMPIMGGKLIEPQHIAHTVLYAISEQARPLTGTGIDIFGGLNLPK